MRWAVVFLPFIINLLMNLANSTSLKRGSDVRYHVVRAALDCEGVMDRRRGRSKYGATKPRD